MDEREMFEAWLKQPHQNNWNDSNHPLEVGERQAAWLAWQAARRTTPDREAIIDSILAKLDPMIRPGIIDEPYHSERNGLIMAWNVVASSKTAPTSDKGGA